MCDTVAGARRAGEAADPPASGDQGAGGFAADTAGRAEHQGNFSGRHDSLQEVMTRIWGAAAWLKIVMDVQSAYTFLMSIDWERQRAFLAVLSEGSLSAAARTLSVAQPTVRRRIEELEGALGVPLFTRSSGGLQPTEAALGLREGGARD